MTDHTPTTDDIEDAWCSRYDGEHSWASGEERRGYEAEFDRWLEQVKAEAWDEGRIDGQINAENEAAIAHGTRKEITNPYRLEQDQ